MDFLTPLAFALTALLPIIVALYFLKLRRTEQRVSSTYLWRTLVRDTAANAPWQRLQPNLLLLLQLLFVIALIVALARPSTSSSAVASSHLILVLDTSASMGATDVKPNRLGQAVAHARQLIQSLPASARVTLIDAGAPVRVPVSGATERGVVLEELGALRPGLSGTDMSSALTLAAAVAANEPDAQVVILSDGHFTLPGNFSLPARAEFVPVGQTGANQAIGAFSLTGETSGRTLTAFVQLINYADEPMTRRLVVRDGNGLLAAARDLNLPPHQSQPVTLPDLPVGNGMYQAQLDGADYLALDDRAWAVAPGRDKARVRVVTTGNRFLETALALLPNVDVTTIKPDELASAQFAASSSQLTILDSVVPTLTLPSGNLFFIAPPRATEFFSVTGQIESPQPMAVSSDDPVLRYVDLRDLAIQDATRLALPRWGRVVWMDRATGAPLLIVGESDGRRIGVLAFDLRHSDLPLQVAFPLLMANLVDALLPGGAGGLPTSVEVGHALTLPVPPEITALTIRAPDGTNYALTPAQGRVVFDRADQPGIYEITSQDGGGQVIRRDDVAVNALNSDESDIAPRPALTLASAGTTSTVELPRARDEWWQPLAWIGLLLLIVEWLYAYRGQVERVLSKMLNVKHYNV